MTDDETDDGSRSSLPVLPTRLTTDALRLESRAESDGTYGCGHAAPDSYALFFKNCRGEETLLEFNEEVRARRQECGACVLERLLGTSIACSLCGSLILVGQQVNTLRGGIRCMDIGCSSPFDLSGNWNGTQVVPIKISFGGPMF